GLSAIHQQNIIHKDLHSGNILQWEWNNKYELLVSDLGHSQPINELSSGDNKIYGVLPYMAPEIL
ncbi:hypothetical protein C2G38_2236048, partial [Gigaspora rosea]